MSEARNPIAFDRMSYHWLSRSVAPVLLALSLGLSHTARAELMITTTSPAFSVADLEKIERNEALRVAVGTEPWLVYKILRELEDADQARELFPARDPGGTKDFDANRDPDLNQFQRASPEGAHDLFLLLKKAGSGGQAK